jgi:hypothetical protein
MVVRGNHIGCLTDFVGKSLQLRGMMFDSASDVMLLGEIQWNSAAIGLKTRSRKKARNRQLMNATGCDDGPVAGLK